MILMIDNYDSFTYNLVQYIEEIGTPVTVARNDVLTLGQIEALNPDGIVISPGPGGPRDAGISLEVIAHFSGKRPVLGVCLGHQSIAHAFGGKIIAARNLMHGKTSMVTGDGQGLFKGIQKPFQAMRYHSLAVERESLPGCLTITAESDDGEIMGLRHKTHLTEGIQFHPESIMTTIGKRLLRNFIKMIDGA
jgi:anthranilate synthase/aminodeoxychorismate synthase-like glutamine amidotransferase